MQNKKIIKAPVGCCRFQIGCVFVEYDLFNTTTYQNCICMNFCINITQFYINFSRQEHLQIDVLCVSFNA